MTYTTNIRLPDELAERLVAFSDNSGVPRNTIIRKALEGYLQEEPFLAPQLDKPVKPVKATKEVPKKVMKRVPAKKVPARQKRTA
jgi:predicted DNA-binding protein